MYADKDTRSVSIRVIRVPSPLLNPCESVAENFVIPSGSPSSDDLPVQALRLR